MPTFLFLIWFVYTFSIFLKQSHQSCINFINHFKNQLFNFLILYVVCFLLFYFCFYPTSFLLLSLGLKWSEVAQSYPTLCNPIDCSLPGSSIHGIFQAIVLEWIAIFFSRGSSQPRAQTRVSRIVDRRFTVWAAICSFSSFLKLILRSLIFNFIFIIIYKRFHCICSFSFLPQNLTYNFHISIII